VTPWNIISIRALPGLCLALRFEDGSSGIVTLKDDELTGVLAPLRSPEYFAQVRLVEGVATWPNGEDLAPERMHANVQRAATT
jgi:hypothetical protein